MTLTTHALVGAAVASFFPEHPYVAFAAGFASHFVLDSIPHWDYTLYSLHRGEDPLDRNMRGGREFWLDLARIAGDALLGLILTFALAAALRIPPELALVGAGAALYPDLLQFVYWQTKWRAMDLLQRFHVHLQKNIYPQPLVGMAYQAMLVLGVILAVGLTRL